MGLTGSWSGPGGGGYRELFLTRFLRDRLNKASFLLFGTGNTATLEIPLQEGVDVVGADVDREVIAAKRLRHGPERFFHPDELPAREFDAVVAVEVLEHFREPARSLRTIFERLAPGGIVCGTTNFYFGRPLENANTPGYMSHAGHVAYWSERSLRRAVSTWEMEIALFHLVRPGIISPDETYGQYWLNKRAFFIFDRRRYAQFFAELFRSTPVLPIDRP